MFDVIERLKAEWTDKYVVIDSPAPELARFADATGTVKTVNMNGRCLVEFDQHNNIGWYDIDPAFLRIVSEPRPKPVKDAKPAAKATTKATTKAATKPATGKRPSTADILAAARGKQAAPDEKPAAVKSTGRPSTAEILAAARGKQSGVPPAAEPPAVESTPLDTVSAPVAEEPAPESAVPPARQAPRGDLPTTTADKIAWCRRHDSKG
jgi:DNA polymerase III gamma/tau subunit